jgi:ABC-type Fe3+-siderophore transport system permease subunit
MNPLAEPAVLGVSSGGASLRRRSSAQVFGSSRGIPKRPWADHLRILRRARSPEAAVFAIASRAGAAFPCHTLVLAGVIVGIFFSSAITVLISVLDFDRPRAV